MLTVVGIISFGKCLQFSLLVTADQINFQNLAEVSEKKQVIFSGKTTSEYHVRSCRLPNACSFGIE